MTWPAQGAVGGGGGGGGGGEGGKPNTTDNFELGRYFYEEDS